MLTGKGQLLLKMVTIAKEFNDLLSKVLHSCEISEFPSDSCCIKIQNLSILKIKKKYIKNVKNKFFFSPVKMNDMEDKNKDL